MPPPEEVHLEQSFAQLIVSQGTCADRNVRHGDQRIPDVGLGLALPLWLSCPLTDGLQVVVDGDNGLTR